MDCDEPHLMLKQPIQWIERLIGALVPIGSLWPKFSLSQQLFYPLNVCLNSELGFFASVSVYGSLPLDQEFIAL